MTDVSTVYEIDGPLGRDTVITADTAYADRLSRSGFRVTATTRKR